MNQHSSHKSSSLGKIDKVDPVTKFAESTGSKWVSVLKAFNLLGPVVDMYAQTLAYKIESKRLDTELKRIEEEAKIANNVIDKTFKLKLEDLEQRRFALVGFYNTVNNQLERLHIERIKVLEMAELATKKTLEPGIDIEERRLFKEMAMEITAQLPNFGDRAIESLKTLANALPPVQIPTALLSYDGNE